MKIIITLLAIFTLIPASLKADAQPLTVAILGFETSDVRLQPAAVEVSERLGVLLGHNPSLRLVERTEIDKILGEQTIGLSGLTDAESAARVGLLLGAKVMIMGRVISTSDNTLLVAKVMSTETSRVFGETATAGKSLAEPTQELADKISALIEKNHTAFVPKVVTRAERVAALRKLVEGAGRTVAVRITEQDLGRPVIDPAAQTEFEKVLMELGFKIFDPRGVASMPSLRIVGEAFSQPGARRGQLLSARARVEVRVESMNGSVLVVDSETATAVDTAEAVAGKTALQEASLSLLERIAPKLRPE